MTVINSDIEEMVEQLDDEESKVYLWRIPCDWTDGDIEILAEEIHPRFDKAFHLFASVTVDLG